MIKLFNILGGIKGILINTGILAIVILIVNFIVLPINNKNIRRPYIKTIDSLENVNVTINKLYIKKGEELELTKSRADSLSIADQVKEGQIGKLQVLVRDFNNTNKANKILISELQKGLRIDLVTIREEKGLFGKIKRTDSTYVTGWKYGQP